MSDCAAIFSDIYRRKVWGEGSGGGAFVDTQPYCDLISRIIRERRPRTVIDIGCGDGRVLAGICFDGVEQVVGIDPVPEAIDTARELNPGIHFICDDARACSLKADLILMKEITQHLDLRTISELLAALQTPCLIHTSIVWAQMNGEIATGEVRGVDLSRAPFLLPCRTLLRYRRYPPLFVQQVNYGD